MSDKEKALQVIQRLPDDATFDDIMYEIYFCERVAKGLDQVRRGEVVPHEDVKREIAAWLKSLGQ